MLAKPDNAPLDFETLQASTRKICTHIAGSGWAGFDKTDLDGLRGILKRKVPSKPRSVLLKSLNRTERKYPNAIRFLLGHRKQIFAATPALLGQGYANLYLIHRDKQLLSSAKQCADWLLQNGSRKYGGIGWGVPFDWQSRIMIPANTPCSTTTVDCGELFLKLYEITGNTEYLQTCRDICELFTKGLNINRVSNDRICFSYTPLDSFHVHNANLLVASFLARTATASRDHSHVATAIEAGNYSAADQRENGSLNYWSEAHAGAFRSDHYHSGYEIRSFFELYKHTGQELFFRSTERYVNYYTSAFFDQNGAPRLNPFSDSIIDILGCSEAIRIGAALHRKFPQTLSLAHRAAAWTINHMQTESGSFRYRIRSGLPINISYTRWGDAPMLLALSALLATTPCPATRTQPASKAA